MLSYNKIHIHTHTQPVEIKWRQRDGNKIDESNKKNSMEMIIVLCWENWDKRNLWCMLQGKRFNESTLRWCSSHNSQVTK